MRVVVVRFVDAGHADGQVRGVLEEVGVTPVPFRSASDLLGLLLAAATRDDAVRGRARDEGPPDHGPLNPT